MTLYDAVKESVDFDLAEFSKILINKVPPYNGFNDADGFMYFFKSYSAQCNPSQRYTCFIFTDKPDNDY